MRVLYVQVGARLDAAILGAATAAGADVRTSDELTVLDQRWADVIIGPLGVVSPLCAEAASSRPTLLAIVDAPPSELQANHCDDYLLSSANQVEIEHRLNLLDRSRQRAIQKYEADTWNHARTQALINAIPDTVFRVTREGRLLDYKPARPTTTQQVGVERGGSNFGELAQGPLRMPPDIFDKLDDAYDKAHSVGGVQFIEFCLEQAGATLTYETRVVACGDESVGITRDITPWKRAEAELAAAAELQRKLSGILVRSLEAERKQVSRDLHDVIGQQILVHRLAADSIARAHSLSEAVAGATDLAKSLDETINAVRTIAHGLRPNAVDDLGLGAGLRGLCQEVSTRTTIAFDMRIDTRCERLGGDASIAIYRIAQEALANAIRHGHSTQIRVAVSCTESFVELEILDNGECGEFERAGGLGLLGIRERAALVGGTAQIAPREGGGTRVLASIPHDAFEFPSGTVSIRSKL